MKGFVGILPPKRGAVPGPESALWKPETGKEEEGILERADRLQRGGPGILTRGMIGELVDRILVFENRGIRIV